MITIFVYYGVYFVLLGTANNTMVNVKNIVLLGIYTEIDLMFSCLILSRSEVVLQHKHLMANSE